MIVYVISAIMKENGGGKKAMNRDYAVIGLGRFGGSICRELSEEGMNVLAIDVNEERINKYKDIASYAVIADSTDETALREIGIVDIDHVIIAIGDNIQASILTAVILADLGIKKITVKAQNDYHERILEKIGAHQVIHPERDMGRRIAHSIISSNILDYLELSNEHSIVEIKVGKKMLYKTLLELNIRVHYGCNVVAIKQGNEINVSPSAHYQLQADDVLIVIGSNRDLSRFEKHLVIDD